MVWVRCGMRLRRGPASASGGDGKAPGVGSGSGSEHPSTPAARRLRPEASVAQLFPGRALPSTRRMAMNGVRSQRPAKEPLERGGFPGWCITANTWSNVRRLVWSPQLVSAERTRGRHALSPARCGTVSSCRVDAAASITWSSMSEGNRGRCLQPGGPRSCSSSPATPRRSPDHMAAGRRDRPSGDR